MPRMFDATAMARIARTVIARETERAEAGRAGHGHLAGGELSRLRVTAIANDYLTCRQILVDGTSDTQDIYVARPSCLRTRDATHPQYATATLTFDGSDPQKATSAEGQVWKVWPAYIASHSVIYAVPAANVETLGGHELNLVDANVDGRAWYRSVALDDLTDVVIASPANGDLLRYDSSDGQWKKAATTTITVVTGVQVSGTTLQVKTRSVAILSMGSESSWTTIHTGTTCP